MKASLVIFALFAVAGAMPANAAKPKATKKPQAKSAKKPTDRQSPAKNIGRAYDLIQSESAEKNVAARKLLSPYLRDPIFGDEALWLTALSQLSDARLEFDAEKFSAALASAEKAHTNLGQVDLRYPHSATLRSQSRDLASAELLQAESLLELGRAKEAQTRYEAGLQRLSSAGQLSQAGHDEVADFTRACKKLPDEFCAAWMARIANFWPKSSLESKGILAADPEAAADAAKRSGGGSPGKSTTSYKAPDLDQAAFDAGFAKYLSGDWGDAIDLFQKMLQDYPRSAYRFRARYWLAQSLAKKGKDEEAKKQFQSLKADSPLTYYGLLASLQAGEPLDVPTDPNGPLASELETSLTAAEIYRMKKARAHSEQGSSDLAALELKDLRARDSMSNAFLMYLAQLNSKVGNHGTAFSLISELILRGSDRVFSAPIFNMIFPVRHLELIKKAALEAKIDPILLLSLIKQESAFDPEIASNSGATGLTQVLYGTALEHFPEIARTDLTDPETNIRTGTKYLAWLLRKYGGNTAAALAAYNAGPTAAGKWMSGRDKKLGELEFVETIPYKESREYVGAILRNYYWYSKLLKEGKPIATLGDLDRLWPAKSQE